MTKVTGVYKVEVMTHDCQLPWMQENRMNTMKIQNIFLIFTLIVASAAQNLDPNALRALVAYNVPQQRDYTHPADGGYKTELHNVNHPGIRGMGVLSQGHYPYRRQYIAFPPRQIPYGRDQIPVGQRSIYPQQRPNYLQSDPSYPQARAVQHLPVNRYGPYPGRQAQPPYRPGVVDLRPFGGLRGLLRLGLPDNVYH